MKQKKGYLIFGLFVVTLFGLTFSYILFTSGDKEEKIAATLGEKQARLMQKYVQGEWISLNIDQAARLAATKARSELYSDLMLENCAQSDGYTVINSCKINADILKKRFTNLFMRHFDAYLATIKTTFDLNQDLGATDYSLDINETVLQGSTKKTIDLSEGEIGYSINPSFKQKFGGGFEQFIAAMKQIKARKECLAKYNELEGEERIIKEFSLVGFDAWKIKRRNDVLYFDVTKHTKEKLVKNIDAQFAINLKTSEIEL